MTRPTPGQIADESLLQVAVIRNRSKCMSAGWYEFSPPRFSQPRLFVCLIRRHVLKIPSHGVTLRLVCRSRVRQAIELNPNFTKLRRRTASRRGAILRSHTRVSDDGHRCLPFIGLL
jgi:hypothetical protein